MTIEEFQAAVDEAEASAVEAIGKLFGLIRQTRHQANLAVGTSMMQGFQDYIKSVTES